MARQAECLLKGERPFTVESPLEVLALQKFRDDAGTPVHCLKDVHNVDDIVGANTGHCANLPLKALQRCGLACVTAMHDLHREASIQPNVVGLIKSAHPARGEHAL